MPVLPDEAFFTLAPDWACEILSPGTAGIDRAVKMPIYAQEGVQWLWLIDPDIRTFEFYRWFERQWLREHTWQNDDVVKAPPFDAISMNSGAATLNASPAVPPKSCVRLRLPAFLLPRISPPAENLL